MKMNSEESVSWDYEPETMPDIFSIIIQVTKNLDKFQRMVLKETALTPSQYAVLNVLSDEEGLTLSQLAKFCFISRPTMTNLIDTLEEKELVFREANPKDRRSSLVKLTFQGKQLNKAAPSLDHIYADCCSILNPKELHQLRLLLEKVNQALMGYLT